MINAENLSYSFDGNRNVLQDLSFCINEGEFVFLIGKNGSGKSTLLKVLDSLLFPNAGNLFIDKINTKDKDFIYQNRAKVSFVFQDVKLSTLGETPLEDISFSLKNMGSERKEIEERSLYFLNLVSLFEKRNKKVSSLSYEERKFLSLSSALSTLPKYLLLDEWDDGLSKEERDRLNTQLIKVNESGTTIIYSTHNEEAIFDGSRVLLLQNGCLIKDGEKSEVLSFYNLSYLDRFLLALENGGYEISRKKENEIVEEIIALIDGGQK